MSLLPKVVVGTPANVRKFKDGFQFLSAKSKRVKLQGFDKTNAALWPVDWHFKSAFVRVLPTTPVDMPPISPRFSIPSFDGANPNPVEFLIQASVASCNHRHELQPAGKPYSMEVCPQRPDVSKNFLQVATAAHRQSDRSHPLDSLTARCQLSPCKVSDNLVQRGNVSNNLVDIIPPAASHVRLVQPPSPALTAISLGMFPAVQCKQQDLASVQQPLIWLVPLQSVASTTTWHETVRFSVPKNAVAEIPVTNVRVWSEEVRFDIATVIGTILNEGPPATTEDPREPPIGRLRASSPNKRPPGSIKRRPPKATTLMLKLLLPILRPRIETGLGRQLDLPGQLRHYQVDGIFRLVSNHAFLLADEMGTGKTVMTIIAIRILIQRGAIFRALVICPKSILNVWETHLKKWAPDLTVSIAYGDPSSRDALWECPAHVYVTTYDILVKDVQQSIPAYHSNRFDLIVADEAHTLRNLTTRRSQAARKLEAGYRWGLTGTPIQNSVDELLSLFRFIKPGLFPAWMTGVTASPAIVSNLIEPFFLRRRKLDVMPELPPKIYSDEWFELDSHQQKEYAALLRQFQQAKTPVNRIAIFSLIQKLKQVCNFATGHNSSPKSEALVEQVAEIVSSGQKVIVFSQYVGAGVEKLRPLLMKHGLSIVTGDVSLAERQRVVKRFQEDPCQQVFLATTKTAGEGLTLTAASYIIHFDHWWNPAVEWQAEDRAHRMGQSQPVNIYNYWVAGTIEQKIRALLEKKGLLHKQYVEALADADFNDAISTEDLCGMLGIDLGRLIR